MRHKHEEQVMTEIYGLNTYAFQAEMEYRRRKWDGSLNRRSQPRQAWWRRDSAASR
jgi:hypothetical protein